MTLAQSGSTEEVVAAFFYGREDIIPEMFSRLQKTLPGMKHDKNRLRHFIYYIERHHRAQCQSLAAQDVVITRPRSRGEIAADFYWAAVCLTRSETDKLVAAASVVNDPPLRREAAGVVSCFS